MECMCGGSSQVFTGVPLEATYKLELWGLLMEDFP